MSTKTFQVGVTVGTRPELIKMAPVIKALRETQDMTPVVIFTGQHTSLVEEMADLFDITPDEEMGVMRPGDTLAKLNARILTLTDELFERRPLDLLLVQGDTTSVLATAMAAFYRRIPVGHVEAGLRTGNLDLPFPEEANRCLVARLAALQFPPTRRSCDALLSEGVLRSDIVITGNTVVDALDLMKNRARMTPFVTEWRRKLDGKRLILATMHRRESWGEPMAQACGAMRDIVAARPDVELIFPVHPGPAVREVVYRELLGIERIHLVEPLDYLNCVGLEEMATLILTDSGGLQEEGGALKKPVLVLRTETERPEAVEAGSAMLVGTDPRLIHDCAAKVLDDASLYDRMTSVPNPFGDGKASGRIIKSIRQWRSTGSPALPHSEEFAGVATMELAP